MFCPFCGTDNSSEQKFCRNCGAMLPVASKTGTLKPSAVGARPSTTSTSTFGSAPFVPPQPPALPKTGKSTYLRESKSTSIEQPPIAEASSPVAPPVAPPPTPVAPPARLNRDYSTQITPKPSTADLYGEQMDSSRMMEEFYETQATFNISEPRTPAISPPPTPAEPPVRTMQMTSMSALNPVEEYDALATTVIPMPKSSMTPAEDVVSEELQSTSESMELSETSTYMPAPAQARHTDELVRETPQSSEPVARTIAMAAQRPEEMNPALEKTDELPRYKEATGDLNSDTLLLTPETQAEKTQEAPTQVFPEKEAVDEFKTVVVPQQSQGVKLPSPPLPQQDWQIDNFKTTVSQPVAQPSFAEVKSEPKEVAASSPPPIPVPPFPSTEKSSATLAPPPAKGNRIVLIAAVAILLFLGASAVVAVYLWKTFSPRVPIVKVPPKQPDVTPQPPPQDPPKDPDPVPAIPEGMVLVPAGEYAIGANSGDEFSGPEHKVRLKSFYVDQTEVTNEQYAAFLKATNRAAPKGWVGGQSSGQPKEPVTGVSFSDAEAYAKWAGKRLPTEEEWEVAASGGAHNLYPWGNSWAEGRANTSENGFKKVVEVGSLKEGKSEFGAYDMCGNVWEWTASTAIPYPGLSKKMVDDDPSRYRIIRGGSFMEKKDYSNTSYRNWVVSTQTSNALGFRCVKDAQ